MFFFRLSKVLDRADVQCSVPSMKHANSASRYCICSTTKSKISLPPGYFQKSVLQVKAGKRRQIVDFPGFR